MNSITPFRFDSHAVRVIDVDGAPWIVAKDVCAALDLTWSGNRIAHVPEEWRGVTSVVTPYGTQEMVVLSEQGLYFFLGRSDKPKALPFQKWVAGDVLPSIRRTGSYGVNPTHTPEPETVTLTKDEYIGFLKMQIEHLQAVAQPKWRGLSDQDKARIKALRAQGLGNAGIGKRIGRSKGTVGSYLRRVRLGAEG